MDWKTSGSHIPSSPCLSPLRSLLRVQPPKFRPHFSRIRFCGSESSSTSFLAASVLLRTAREVAASHVNLQRDHNPCPESSLCEARRSGSLPSLELSPSFVRTYLRSRGDCETFFLYACESPAERKGAGEAPGERRI